MQIDLDPQHIEDRHCWQPVLEIKGAGLCLTLDIWFVTEAECVDWIKANVAGATIGDA